MKSLFVAFLLGTALSAQAVCQADVYVDVGNFVQQQLNNRKVVFTLTNPIPRFNITNVVTPESFSRMTDKNGYCVFSNMIWGNYTMTLSGNPSLTFPFTVNTNTCGYYNVIALAGITNVPNPEFEFYTKIQIDALLAALCNSGCLGGGGTNLPSYVLTNGYTAPAFFQDDLYNTNTGSIFRVYDRVRFAKGSQASLIYDGSGSFNFQGNLSVDEGYKFYGDGSGLTNVGGAQTPWTSDINASGHTLTNGNGVVLIPTNDTVTSGFVIRSATNTSALFQINVAAGRPYSSLTDPTFATNFYVDENVAGYVAPNVVKMDSGGGFTIGNERRTNWPSSSGEPVASIADFGGTAYQPPVFNGVASVPWANLSNNVNAYYAAQAACIASKGVTNTVFFPQGIWQFTSSLSITGKINWKGVGISHVADKGSPNNLTYTNTYSILAFNSTNAIGVIATNLDYGYFQMSWLEICGATNPIAFTEGASPNLENVPSSALNAGPGLLLSRTSSGASDTAGGFQANNVTISGFKRAMEDRINSCNFDTVNFVGCDFGPYFTSSPGTGGDQTIFQNCAVGERQNGVGYYGGLSGSDGPRGLVIIDDSSYKIGQWMCLTDSVVSVTGGNLELITSTNIGYAEMWGSRPVLNITGVRIQGTNRHSCFVSYRERGYGGLAGTMSGCRLDFPTAGGGYTNNLPLLINYTNFACAIESDFAGVQMHVTGMKAIQRWTEDFDGSDKKNWIVGDTDVAPGYQNSSIALTAYNNRNLIPIASYYPRFQPGVQGGLGYIDAIIDGFEITATTVSNSATVAVVVTNGIVPGYFIAGSGITGLGNYDVLTGTRITALSTSSNITLSAVATANQTNVVLRVQGWTRKRFVTFDQDNTENATPNNNLHDVNAFGCYSVTAQSDITSTNGGLATQGPNAFIQVQDRNTTGVSYYFKAQDGDLFVEDSHYSFGRIIDFHYGGSGQEYIDFPATTLTSIGKSNNVVDYYGRVGNFGTLRVTNAPTISVDVVRLTDLQAATNGAAVDSTKVATNNGTWYNGNFGNTSATNLASLNRADAAANRLDATNAVKGIVVGNYVTEPQMVDHDASGLTITNLSGIQLNDGGYIKDAIGVIRFQIDQAGDNSGDTIVKDAAGISRFFAAIEPDQSGSTKISDPAGNARFSADYDGDSDGTTIIRDSGGHIRFEAKKPSNADSGDTTIASGTGIVGLTIHDDNIELSYDFNSGTHGITNVVSVPSDPKSVAVVGDFTITQTNFVLNTVYEAGTRMSSVRATTTLVTAVVSGNAALNLMVDQAGGTTFTILSQANITTLAVTGLAMTYNLEIDAYLNAGAKYYFTNASVGTGNSGSIKAGTGQLTTF